MMEDPYNMLQRNWLKAQHKDSSKNYDSLAINDVFLQNDDVKER